MQNAASKLENSLAAITKITVALKTFISGEDLEFNLDISFDKIVNNLLDVKTSLEEPNLKEVYVCPSELVPTEKINFKPPESPSLLISLEENENTAENENILPTLKKKKKSVIVF